MSRGTDGERGMATAELAVAIPSLVLVLALALAAVDLGIAQVRCVDAARVGARLLARGEPWGTVAPQVRQAAPEGARVSTSSGQGTVSVVVTARLPTALRSVGMVPAPSATAVARLETEP